ncbi:transposable element Tcb1 transposase [Trichonephila clavipes]|nr:transposable element Tcb1 transposase [Trichonephila clavipes]
MDLKGKEITPEEKKIIIKLKNECKNLREIGKTVGKTHSSIQRVINNYTSSKSVISKPRSGRPSKLTLREKSYVFKSICLNPRLSASQIANDIRERFKKHFMCEDIIRKILKKAGYHGRVAHKKPPISAVKRQKRLDFANEHVNKPPQFWEKVLFSDESKFCIFGIKGRKLVWRKQGTALEKENLVPTVKYGGGGVMVWGCMAANGVGRRTFIDSTLNHMGFINILKENLKQGEQDLNLGDDFWFQEDNDPKHTAHNVKLWLLYNIKNQLRSPPQSPDLNPIEHLWALLERKISQHPITSK